MGGDHCYAAEANTEGVDDLGGGGTPGLCVFKLTELHVGQVRQPLVLCLGVNVVDVLKGKMLVHGE